MAGCGSRSFFTFPAPDKFWLLTKIFSVSDRLAAKIFVFVISCFLSLEFRVTRNQNVANILTNDFLNLKLVKITGIYFWDTTFIKSKWILINFHLGQRKFCFPDFMKAQK